MIVQLISLSDFQRNKKAKKEAKAKKKQGPNRSRTGDFGKTVCMMVRSLTAVLHSTTELPAQVVDLFDESFQLY